MTRKQLLVLELAGPDNGTYDLNLQVTAGQQESSEFTLPEFACGESLFLKLSTKPNKSLLIGVITRLDDGSIKFVVTLGV